MNKSIKVLSLTRGFVRDSAILEASENCSVVFDSFLGERIFFLEEGDRLKIRMKKNSTFKGDTFNIAYLVRNAANWANIPWSWNH